MRQYDRDADNYDYEDEDDLENTTFTIKQATEALTSVLRFLLPYLRPYRPGLVWLTLGVLIETLYNAAFPLGLKYLIDEALYDANYNALQLFLIVLSVLGISVSIVTIWYEYQNSRLGSAVLRDIRQGLFQHLQMLSMQFYSNVRVGEVLSRFSSDLTAVESIVMHGMSWILLPLLEIPVAAILLLYLSWQTALIVLLISPLTLIGPRLFSPGAIAASYQNKLMQAETISVVQENVAAQSVVKAFGLQTISLRWFKRRNARLTQTVARVSFLNAMVERSVSIAVLVLHLLIIGFGAYLTFQKKITVGTLVSFEGVFWDLSYNVSHFINFVPSLIHAAGSIQHINDLLAEPLRIADVPNATILPRLEREIVFDDVSFSYTQQQMQLKNLNFRISCGSSVAIVGSSGSGKSTILNLLLRLYEPTSGAVKIDDRDLRYVTQESLRSQMAVVFQENILFNISLGENIHLGNPNATETEVKAAARAAEIDEFIKSLPQGYDTIVGERGGTLSGGQRQRIAIARAIIRDPAILLLDEATSALDRSTEAAIATTLKRIAKKRTVISVTHRLTSVVDFDRIFVLDRGSLRETGTHKELLQLGGLYCQIWQKQSGDSISITT